MSIEEMKLIEERNLSIWLNSQILNYYNGTGLVSKDKELKALFERLLNKNKNLVEERLRELTNNGTEISEDNRTDIQVLIDYLEYIRNDRPTNKDFIEQVESLKNLPKELNKEISIIHNIRTKIVPLSFIDHLLDKCSEF